MKFKLHCGTHHDSKTGKTYEPGDVIETNQDLEKLNKNAGKIRFERLDKPKVEEKQSTKKRKLSK